MDKITFTILIVVNLIFGGSIFYFHSIHNTPLATNSGVDSDSVLGIDSDNNGIRDDIEDYIKSNFTDSREIGALLQYAKKTQTQLAKRNNPEEVSRLAHDKKDYNCGLFVFEKTRGNRLGFFDATEELDKVILNTKARLAAYEIFNRNVPGGIYGGPEPSIDDCEFYQNETSN